jgi:hypothetical protein
MTDVIDIEVAALETINLTRQRFGQEPLRAMPQGHIQEPEDCPVQRALRDLGLGASLEVFINGVKGVERNRMKALRAFWRKLEQVPSSERLPAGTVALPLALARFVEAFDDGELLHLDLSDIVRPEDVAAVQDRLRIPEFSP